VWIKFGAQRRWSMIAGISIAAVSLIVIGFGFFFATGTAQIAVVGVAIATFFLGLATPMSLFWVLITDLVPGNLKGPSSSFANVLVYLFQLVLSISFPPILQSIGQDKVYAIFWAYAVIAIICMICLCFMPLARKINTTTKCFNKL